MRLTALTFVLVLTVGSVHADDEAVKKELEKLQGSWQFVKGERQGMPYTDDVIKGMRVVIESNKLTLTDGKEKISGILTLKPSEKPAQFDLEASDLPITICGIYKLEKDTFTIIFSLSGDKNRPKDFTPGKETVYFVMGRVKN